MILNNGNSSIWAASWQTNKMNCANTQISLGICPVWSESLLSAWRNLWSLATHWAHSDQTGRMPRLIRVLAGMHMPFCWLCHAAAHICSTACKIWVVGGLPFHMLSTPIWAMSWENLIMPYANNKGADQPAHPVQSDQHLCCSLPR